jgi:RNA polymerase sigma-70 factor (ECF subfamily)
MVDHDSTNAAPLPGQDETAAPLLGARVPEAVFIASFAEFYSVHHGKIAASLALNFGDTELGAEAADEAMARAYAQWGVVSGHNNPAGWVYRVGLNWGRSWFRRAGRRLPWLDRTTSELPETADPALRKALLGLDQKHREVVVCRYFLDWSTKQTAAALDLPLGTVKSRLHQALSQLRRELEPADDMPSATAPTSATTSTSSTSSTSSPAFAPPATPTTPATASTTPATAWRAPTDARQIAQDGHQQ